ncbi:MAG: lysophospholipid acyltransferase family protein [Bacteroidota bacterium]
MNRLTYFFFLFFVYFLGMMPFGMMYALSGFFYTLVYYVLGYRKKVVISNLLKAFPEKSAAEIKSISRRFYRYFTDMLLEGVKGFSMSKLNIIRRHKLLNPELLDEYFKRGQSVIGVTAHFGNFEWGTMSGGLQIQHLALGFYKPMSNHYVDAFIRRSRAKHGTVLTSIYQTHRTFVNYEKECCIYLMIADQNPSNKNKAIWADFLGIETAFLHGPENYALHFNYPVIYIDIKPVRRGFYEIELVPMVEDPSQMSPGEITQLYAKYIENRIQQQPQYWLWSHKRWKYGKLG